MNPSKQAIIENLRRNIHRKYEMPKIEVHRENYLDQVEKFMEMVGKVGGRPFELQENETIGDAVRRIYPDAKTIGSNLAEVTCATFNPDDAKAPEELNGADLIVCRGLFGVCENGAVYYEQAYDLRASYFIAENLLIIVDRRELVDTMLEAYRRIPNEFTAEFRGFISGPSKTADIEQALVKGAHGPRDTAVLVV